ncbi:MAG: transporter substrate-binding domain-containing protein, partial [bacterium]
APLKTFTNASIVVGADRNYPPWEYMDENGKPAGFNVELTKAIASEMNIDIRFYFSSWSDVKRKLNNGDIEILQGMFYSSERAEEFEFSSPYFSTSFIVVSRRNTPSPQSIEDLKEKIILVEKDDIMHDFAVQNLIGDSIISFNDCEAALKSLASGNGDYVLMGKIQAEYFIKKNDLTELLVSDFNLKSEEYCYAVKKGNEAILSLFEEGFSIIKNNGEYRRIRNKWFGLSREDKLANTLTNLKYAFIFLMAVLIGFALFSFSLKKAVERRTAELAEENKKRAEAEKNLIDSRNYLNKLIETIPVPIFYKDRNGKYLIVNPSFEEFYGVTKEEIEGKSIFEFTGEREAESLHAKDLELMKTGEVQIYETEIQNKFKEIRNVIFHKALLRDHKNEINGIVGIILDVTQLKKTEEDMRNLDRLNALGIFAGGIAHDFNNLLTGIMGNLDLILSLVPKEGVVVRFVENAMKTAEAASGLSKQLLTFAAGGQPMKTVVTAKKLIEETTEFLTRGSDAQIKINIDKNSKNITADESQLRQVISNIIINSMQAMPKGLKLEVSIRNAQYEEVPQNLVRGDYLTITIKDNGPGIDKKIIGRIFNPFFTTKATGNGLGLAVAYSIMKKHGGEIKAASTEGAGSEFVLYLPSTESVVSKQNYEEADSHDFLLKNLKILVMDDEKVIRDVLYNILKSCGCEAETSERGEDAVELYENAIKNHKPFDIVVLDLTVHGGMGGKDTASKIKEIDPEAKLIVSSGYSEDDIMADYKNYGFSGVVTKPYVSKILIAEIERVLKDRVKNN